ncbi:MAG: hypothetical protein AAF628_25150 [Planctomycetota bacterium]
MQRNSRADDRRNRRRTAVEQLLLGRARVDLAIAEDRSHELGSVKQLAGAL